MKNKPGDMCYCGVRPDFIKNATPKINMENLKILFSWIKERYTIHIKKDIQHLSPPWTKDKILLKYRFCNVRREHDKESKLLFTKILSNKEISYENKILNAILFRLFNKSQTLEIFGDFIDFKNLDISLEKQKIEKFIIKNPQYVFFSNAFFTSGPKVIANRFFSGEKLMPVKILLLVKKYEQEGVIDLIKNSRSQEEVYLSLKKMSGIGNFLAYQIFVDLTFITNFPFSENEFVIAGPGCIKGEKLIFDDFDGMSYEEALFWLRDNQEILGKEFNFSARSIFEDLEDFDKSLNVMCLENCMCEFSKYYRAINNLGRPRIIYKRYHEPTKI